MVRSMSSVTTLERELYSTAEAARLLSMSSVTLKRWLEGATRKGVFYPPVLRADPRGSDVVTWGEFVEAGLLREYRSTGVLLQTRRPFIADLRSGLGINYPLAHARPYVLERQLVLELQEAHNLDPRVCVVATGPHEGQLVLTDQANQFVEKVEFDDDAARRIRPAGPDSPVTIDPEKSFGIPTIRGIRTENVVELFQAGESIGAIAEAFDLEPHEVEAALRFESAA